MQSNRIVSVIYALAAALALTGYLLSAASGHAGIRVKPETPTAMTIEVNLAQSKAAIGGMFLPLPMLVEINDQYNATDILVSGEDEALTLAHGFAKLEFGQHYAWIDRCDHLGMVFPDRESETPDTGKTCMIAGQRGYKPKRIALQGEKTFFEFSNFNDFPAPRINLSIENFRIRNLQTLLGDLPIVVQKRELEPETRGLLFRSVGYQNGKSLIRKKTWDSIQSGRDTEIPKGVSLIGVTNTGGVRVLDNFFDCNAEFTVSAVSPWAEQIAANSTRYSFFAVMAHDTAFCRENTSLFAPILADLPLKDFAKIGFRRPYLAIFHGDEMVFEGSNTASGRLSVYLEGADRGEESWIRVSRNPLAEKFAVKPLPLEPRLSALEIEPKPEPVLDQAEQPRSGTDSELVETPSDQQVFSPVPVTGNVNQPLDGSVAGFVPDAARIVAGNLGPVTRTTPAVIVANARPLQELPIARNISSENILECEATGNCCREADYRIMGNVEKPFPEQTRSTLAQAIDKGLVSLGKGWWPQSTGGYRIGAQNAELSLQLPSSGAPLKLVVSSGQKTPLKLAGLTWQGEFLPRLPVPDGSGAAFDLSRLPRETVLQLGVITAESDMECIASPGGKRLLSASLVGAIALQTHGFENPLELVIHHDATSVHEKGTYQWLESVKARSRNIELEFSELSGGLLACTNPMLESQQRMSADGKSSRFSARLANNEFICDFDGVAAWLRTNREHRVYFTGTQLSDQALMNAIATNRDVAERINLLVRDVSRISRLFEAGFVRTFRQAEPGNLPDLAKKEPGAVHGLIMTSRDFLTAVSNGQWQPAYPVLLRGENVAVGPDCNAAPMPTGLFVSQASAGYWNDFNTKCSRG